MNNEHYGASLERGVIESIQDGKYRVASLTRDGISSMPIRPVHGEDVYQVGDRVYFFLFGDGDGLILSKM